MLIWTALLAAVPSVRAAETCTDLPKDTVDAAWAWVEQTCEALDADRATAFGCDAVGSDEAALALYGETASLDLSTLKCGAELELYENKGEAAASVLVVAGDYCPGQTSFLVARTEAGRAVPGEVAAIVEGRDQTYALSVPSGGSLTLDCNNGCAGDSVCTWRVVGAL